MADSPDIYAGSRASLRESLKWYLAALAGIAVLLAGSLSFGILPDLTDEWFMRGVLVGGLIVFLLLIGLWQVQEILTVRPFHKDEVEKPAMAAMMAPFLDTLLPGDIAGFDDLETKLAHEEEQNPKNLVEIDRLETLRAKVVSLAAFLDLQKRMRRVNRTLLALFVLICVGAGFLSYAHGKSKVATKTGTVALRFAPGENWLDYGLGLAGKCPVPDSGVFEAQGKPDTPFAGWWTITLAGTQCKDVVISVPGSIVMPAEALGLR